MPWQGRRGQRSGHARTHRPKMISSCQFGSCTLSWEHQSSKRLPTRRGEPCSANATVDEFSKQDSLQWVDDQLWSLVAIDNPLDNFNKAQQDCIGCHLKLCCHPTFDICQPSAQAKRHRLSLLSTSGTIQEHNQTQNSLDQFSFICISGCHVVNIL